MENDAFSDVSWQSPPRGNTERARGSTSVATAGEAQSSTAIRAADDAGDAPGKDPLDNAGVGSGTLECTVSMPLKEGDGSKDSYVSYLVITNVCPLPSTSSALVAFADETRPTSPPSKSQPHPSAGDSPISSFCIIPYIMNTHNVQSRLCPTSTA